MAARRASIFAAVESQETGLAQLVLAYDSHPCLHQEHASLPPETPLILREEIVHGYAKNDELRPNGWNPDGGMRKENEAVTIRVITVAREYGSGGAEVGRRLARDLGWRFIDRELIERTARLAGVSTSAAEEYDERPESWLTRMISGLRAAAPEAYALPAPAEIFDANAMHALTEHVIRSVADTGECVIVGRGSQCILQEREDVLHVFVYAPDEERIARLRRRWPEEKDLPGMIAEVDRERAACVRQYYGRDWQDRHLYDLCINSQLGIQEVAAIVATTAQLAGAPSSAAIGAK